MKFVATYTSCVQVGIDTFNDKSVSKVFDYSKSMQDVMDWLGSIGVKNPTLPDVRLSELMEDV